MIGRARIAFALGLSLLIGLAIAGCASSPPQPSRALLALPAIGAPEAIENSFDEPSGTFRGDVVATFATSDGIQGAVVLNRGGCALALVAPGSSSGGVVAPRFAQSGSASANERIDGRTVAGVIGPNSAGSFSDTSDHIPVVTIFCGLRGVVVDVGGLHGSIAVRGAAILARGSGSTKRLLVVGPPAVLAPLR